MANDLTHDPLVLDTAHATNVVVPGSIFIYGIKWTGPTTAAHIAELQIKATAKVFWRAVSGTIAPQSLDILRIFTPSDLILPTLSSGMLLIYRGPER